MEAALNLFDMGLTDDPFSTQQTKGGLLRIFRGCHAIMSLGVRRAKQLIQALDSAEDEAACQQLLARATGQYWHGNERMAKPARPKSG